MKAKERSCNLRMITSNAEQQKKLRKTQKVRIPVLNEMQFREKLKISFGDVKKLEPGEKVRAGNLKKFCLRDYGAKRLNKGWTKK